LIAQAIESLGLVGASDSATVLAAECFDLMAASLDEPPVPNRATRDAFRRLDEVVTRRPESAG